MTDEALHAEAAKLDAVAARACAELERFSFAEIWEIAKRLQLGVPRQFNAQDVALGDWVLPSQVFTSAGDLEKAIRERTKQARIVAVPILVDLDKERAASLFGEAMMPNVMNAYALSYASALTRGVWARWTELQELVPKPNFVHLWFEGRFRIDALTDDHIRSVPLEEIEAWARQREASASADDAQRICIARADLGSLEASLAFLERIMGEPPYTSVQRAFIAQMSRVFAWKRYEPALPMLRRVGAREALFTMNDRVSLEPIADLLDGLVTTKKLAWDPHHSTPELRDPIRASFQLEPARAFDRLGKYLAPEFVATEHGAKVANDILLLGGGLIFNHGGSKLPSGDGAVVAADPRFIDALRAIANHPRLKQRVRALLQSMNIEVPPEVKEKKAAKKKPVSAAKKKPVSAAKKKPVSAAKKKLVSAAKKKPVSAAKKKPVSAAKSRRG